MSKPKILLTRHWPQPTVDRLSESYEVILPAGDTPLSSADLTAAMTRFDAICPTVTDRIDGKMLSGNLRVRILANYGAGLDHIDLDAAHSIGLTVTNTPDVLTEATAELTILLMLAALRRAAEGYNEVVNGRWQGWRPTHMMGAGMRGRRLGLIGFGRIAQATARIAANGFGMEVDYYARSEKPLAASVSTARWRQDLNALIADADVLSIHLPGGAETEGLIGSDAFLRMKPTAVLVNTARGSIIDDEALIHALNNQQIAGAGLDVYAREPWVEPRLAACTSAFLLPHLGSATVEARTEMGFRVADNLDRFFAGKAPLDLA